MHLDYSNIAAKRLGILGIYILSFLLSLAVARTGEGALLLWFHAGIAVDAVFLLGYSIWWALAAVTLALALLAGYPPVQAIGYMIGGTLQAVAGAYVLRRSEGFQPSFDRVRDVMWFLAVAAAAPLAGALPAAGFLMPDGLAAAGLTYEIMGWWAAAALGTLTAGPALLIWGERCRFAPSARDWTVAGILAAGLGIHGVLIFGPWFQSSAVLGIVLFLVFPWGVGAGWWYGRRGAAGVVVLCTGIAAWGTARGWGPLAAPADQDLEAAWMMLAYLGTFAGISYLMAAARTEIQKSHGIFKEREELYRNAIAQAEAVFYQHDYLTNQYTFMGEKILEITGYPPDEMTPQLWQSMVRQLILRGEGAHLPPQEAIRRFRQGEFKRWKCDAKIQTKRGEYRWIADAAIELVDEGSQVSTESIGIIQDITERKRTEEALRESEERFRILFNSGDDMVFAIAVTPEGEMNRFVEVNEPACRILGYTKDEFIALSPHVLLSPEREKEPGGDGLRRVVQEKGRQVEAWFPTRSGKPIPVEYVTHLIDLNGQPTLLVIGRDITERKRAEEIKAKLEEQLRQSQKMHAIGELTAGIAHNFNNLLMGIIGNLDLALLHADDTLRPWLNSAMTASRRSADLVKDLMLFSRKAEPRREAFDLADMIDEVVDICRSTFDRKIAIEFQRPAEPVYMVGDPVQLHQTLLNLCINARDAFHAKREAEDCRIQLELADHAPPPQSSPAGETGAPAHYARVTVRDNGVGMDPETQKRIFEPFYTTKEVGKGTGLGLSIAYGIVRQHRGWIECESQPGMGTAVHCYLRVEIPAAIPKKARRIEEKPDGTETLLVIDDEKIIRDLMKTILEEYGYHVLTAEDGLEGLRMYFQEKSRIALVIVDLSMPHVSGQEVLAELWKDNPSAKAIVASGFSMDSPGLAKAKAFLKKPFQMHTLLQTVRRVLDE
ncbi:MAG: PAS domain S-box protein [bacterium]